MQHTQGIRAPGEQEGSASAHQERGEETSDPEEAALHVIQDMLRVSAPLSLPACCLELGRKGFCDVAHAWIRHHFECDSTGKVIHKKDKITETQKAIQLPDRALQLQDIQPLLATFPEVSQQILAALTSTTDVGELDKQIRELITVANQRHTAIPKPAVKGKGKQTSVRRLTTMGKAERVLHLKRKRMQSVLDKCIVEPVLTPTKRRKCPGQESMASSSTVSGSPNQATDLEGASPEQSEKINSAAGHDPPTIEGGSPEQSEKKKRKGKQKSPPLWMKVKAITYFRELPSTVVNKEAQTRMMFPILSRSGMLGRWIKASKKYAWCAMPEAELEKKEIRKGARSALGLPEKHKSKDFILPMEFQIEYDKMLTEQVSQTVTKKDLRQVLSNRNIVIGMKELIGKYNARAKQANKEILAHNMATKKKYQSGELAVNNVQELQELTLPFHPLAKGSPNKVWVKRWCRKFQWKERVLSAPSTSLPYDHPKIVAYRSLFSERMKDKKVNFHLLLNYDQVWRIRYRGPKSKKYKREELAGKTQTVLTASDRKLLKRVREADVVNVAVGSVSDEPAPKKQRNKWDSTGKEEVVMASVVEARRPHTVVTSTWADGSPGPLVFWFAPGSFPSKEADRLNKKYASRLHIFFTGKDTHFMDGESTLRTWEEFFGPIMSMRQASTQNRE